MSNQEKQSSSALERYVACLEPFAADAPVLEQLGSIGPAQLRQADCRRLLAHALLPLVLTTAMEWSDEKRPLREQVETGNRALFRAMRAYRGQEDGALYAFLVRQVEAAVAD